MDSSKNFQIFVAFTLGSLFVVLILPSLLSVNFADIVYRFKAPFNGVDFGFYYIDSIKYFHNNYMDILTEKMFPVHHFHPDSHYYAGSPLMPFFLWPFTQFDFVVAYRLFVLLSLAASFIALVIYFEGRLLVSAMWMGLYLVSYPMLGALEKGQVALYLFPLALLFFHTWTKKQYFWSLVCLALLVHLKTFPVFVFFFVAIYLLYIRQFKALLGAGIIFTTLLLVQFPDYVEMFRLMQKEMIEWTVQGGVINHSIFSFSYYVDKIAGFSPEGIIKLAYWSMMAIFGYLVYKTKEISHNTLLFLFCFSTSFPGESYFYNLCLFIAYAVLYVKSNDWIAMLLISIIVSFPLHMTYKGVIPDLLVAAVSIKFIPIFLLMIYTTLKEYKQYKRIHNAE